MLPVLCLRDCMLYTSKLLGFLVFMFVLDCIVSLFRKDYK